MNIEHEEGNVDTNGSEEAGLGKSNSLIISKSAAKTLHKYSGKPDYNPTVPAISSAATLRKTGASKDFSKSRNMKS